MTYETLSSKHAEISIIINKVLATLLIIFGIISESFLYDRAVLQKGFLPMLNNWDGNQFIAEEENQ